MYVGEQLLFVEVRVGDADADASLSLLISHVKWSKVK